MRPILLVLIGSLLAPSLFPQGSRDRGEPPAPPESRPLAGASASQPEAEASGPISSEELARLIAGRPGEVLLIDVRTPQEYRSGAIPTAVNVPYDLLAGSLPAEDRSARIVVYCQSGRRSAIAKSTLDELGFRNVIDFGGIGRWKGETVIPK
jgi:rhodanese-related sulfurtransferase